MPNMKVYKLLIRPSRLLPNIGPRFNMDTKILTIMETMIYTPSIISKPGMISGVSEINVDILYSMLLPSTN